MDTNRLKLVRAAIKNGLPPHRLMLAPDCGLGFLPLQVFDRNHIALRNWILYFCLYRLLDPKSDCFEKFDFKGGRGEAGKHG